jgi:Helix-turn-helix of DDE superfamily endonuclease
MTYDQISQLHGKRFRRIVGVKESVFALMVSTVKTTKDNLRKHPKRGQNSALSVENQVLMTCLFWREYRDQEHIALDFGIHQSTVSRIIRQIEKILIQSGAFSLPGKKVLKSGGLSYETIIVDVTETPTQRPKKNKSGSIAERKNAIL